MTAIHCADKARTEQGAGHGHKPMSLWQDVSVTFWDRPALVTSPSPGSPPPSLLPSALFLWAASPGGGVRALTPMPWPPQVHSDPEGTPAPDRVGQPGCGALLPVQEVSGGRDPGRRGLLTPAPADSGPEVRPGPEGQEGLGEPAAGGPRPVAFCRSRGGRHIIFYPTLKVRVGRVDAAPSPVTPPHSDPCPQPG